MEQIAAKFAGPIVEMAVPALQWRDERRSKTGKTEHAMKTSPTKFSSAWDQIAPTRLVPILFKKRLQRYNHNHEKSFPHVKSITTVSVLLEAQGLGVRTMRLQLHFE